MSSSERSSSATPPPSIPVPKSKKSKGKRKSQAQDQGKNEGTDLNWAFAPPPGSTLLEEEDADAGELDWDKINDDEDLELCLIRVPDSVSFFLLLLSHSYFAQTVYIFFLKPFVLCR